MKGRKLLSIALLAVSGSLACEDIVTQPNTVDPTGPNVSLVALCRYPSDNTQQNGCTSTATLSAGASTSIEAVATSGSQDLTNRCTFVWAANRNSVRIAVNRPSNSAVVTANASALSSGVTITATCNGVSGSFNVFVN
jgi:hypothetical protein